MIAHTPYIVTTTDTAGRWRAHCETCMDGSTPSPAAGVSDGSGAHVSGLGPVVLGAHVCLPRRHLHHPSERLARGMSAQLPEQGRDIVLAADILSLAADSSMPLSFWHSDPRVLHACEVLGISPIEAIAGWGQ